MTRLVVLFFGTLLLVGCHHGVNKAELPGVYSFEGNGLKQRIAIDPNGQYVNSLFSNGVLAWSEKGEWTYETQGSETGVTFSKFRFGLEDTPTRAGYWFVVPERTFLGRKELCFDIDLNRCFQSQAN